MESSSSTSNNNNLGAIWRQCCFRMGERLSPEEVRMWFGEDAAVPVSLTDDRFVLGFPPNTFVDWVEKNYRVELD